MKRHIDAIFGISLLTVASIVNAILAFGTQTMLVRAFEPNDYGIIAASLGTIAIITPVVGFGVGQLWVLKFSESWNIGRNLVRPSYFYIGGTAVLAFFSVWALSNLHTVDDGTKDILRILSLSLLGAISVELLSAKFQIEGRIKNLALTLIAQNALRIVFVASVILPKSLPVTMENIAACYSFAALIISIVAASSLKNFGGLTHWVRAPDGNILDTFKIKQVARSSFPFGAAVLLQLIYYQSDVVMLKYLSAPEQAGFYNIAFTIVSATYLLPTAVFQRYFLPKVHHWAFHDPNRLIRFCTFGGFAIGALGLVVVGILWPSSDFLIEIFFGRDYLEAAPALQLLLLSVPAIYISYSFGTILVTRENIGAKTVILAIVATFNISLNFTLIPTMGAKGAAIATIASAYLLLLLYTIRAIRVLRKS